jgi:hypothetical protein
VLPRFRGLDYTTPRPSLIGKRTTAGMNAVKRRGKRVGCPWALTPHQIAANPLKRGAKPATRGEADEVDYRGKITMGLIAREIIILTLVFICLLFSIIFSILFYFRPPEPGMTLSGVHSDLAICRGWTH